MTTLMMVFQVSFFESVLMVGYFLMVNIKELTDNGGNTHAPFP